VGLHGSLASAAHLGALSHGGASSSHLTTLNGSGPLLHHHHHHHHAAHVHHAHGMSGFQSVGENLHHAAHVDGGGSGPGAEPSLTGHVASQPNFAYVQQAAAQAVEALPPQPQGLAGAYMSQPQLASHLHTSVSGHYTLELLHDSGGSGGTGTRSLLTPHNTESGTPRAGAPDFDALFGEEVAAGSSRAPVSSSGGGGPIRAAESGAAGAAQGGQQPAAGAMRVEVPVRTSQEGMQHPASGSGASARGASFVSATSGNICSPHEPAPTPASPWHLGWHQEGGIRPLPLAGAGGAGAAGSADQGAPARPFPPPHLQTLQEVSYNPTPVTSPTVTPAQGVSMTGTAMYSTQHSMLVSSALHSAAPSAQPTPRTVTSPIQLGRSPSSSATSHRSRLAPPELQQPHLSGVAGGGYTPHASMAQSPSVRSHPVALPLVADELGDLVMWEEEEAVQSVGAVQVIPQAVQAAPSDEEVAARYAAVAALAAASANNASKPLHVHPAGAHAHFKEAEGAAAVVAVTVAVADDATSAAAPAAADVASLPAEVAAAVAGTALPTNLLAQLMPSVHPAQRARGAAPTETPPPTPFGQPDLPPPSPPLQASRPVTATTPPSAGTNNQMDASLSGQGSSSGYPDNPLSPPLHTMSAPLAKRAGTPPLPGAVAAGVTAAVLQALEAAGAGLARLSSSASTTSGTQASYATRVSLAGDALMPMISPEQLARVRDMNHGRGTSDYEPRTINLATLQRADLEKAADIMEQEEGDSEEGALLKELAQHGAGGYDSDSDASSVEVIIPMSALQEVAAEDEAEEGHARALAAAASAYGHSYGGATTSGGAGSPGSALLDRRRVALLGGGLSSYAGLGSMRGASMSAAFGSTTASCASRGSVPVASTPSLLMRRAPTCTRRSAAAADGSDGAGGRPLNAAVHHYSLSGSTLLPGEVTGAFSPKAAVRRGASTIDSSARTPMFSPRVTGLPSPPDPGSGSLGDSSSAPPSTSDLQQQQQQRQQQGGAAYARASLPPAAERIREDDEGEGDEKGGEMSAADAALYAAAERAGAHARSMSAAPALLADASQRLAAAAGSSGGGGAPGSEAASSSAGGAVAGAATGARHHHGASGDSASGGEFARPVCGIIVRVKQCRGRGFYRHPVIEQAKVASLKLKRAASL